MSRFRVASISMLILLMMAGSAFAGGPFGSPEPLSKESGGLHTAVGYWHSEDKFKDSANRVIRQNQIYSEAAYGAGNAWEIYARIGVSDVTIFDAFTATSPGTTSSKNDFEENWKFFTTLGAKGFYQFNKTFGIGAFVQGTYCFRDLEDDVAGADNGVPYDIELRIEQVFMGCKFRHRLSGRLSLRRKIVFRSVCLLCGGESLSIRNRLRFELHGAGNDDQKQNQYRRIRRNSCTPRQGLPLGYGRTVLRKIFIRGCREVRLLTDCLPVRNKSYAFMTAIMPGIY